MNRVLVFNACYFQYKPCAFCATEAVCWVLACTGRTMCFTCFEARNPPVYHYMYPLFTQALQEFERRGLMPVPGGEDIPLERMIAAADMEWWKELSHANPT